MPNTLSNSPADDQTNSSARSGGFVGHAMIVSILTLVSRITGLVREAVLAAGFGRGPIADAFIFGFQVPNLARRLFGEGALTSAFIPVYTQLLHNDRATASRLASLALALLVAILGGLTILGELVLAAVLSSRAWSADAALAIRLTMVMLPYMPLVCLVAMLGAVLQVHKRFAPPAAAPIILNVVVVIALVIATWGVDSHEVLRQRVFWVALSILIAGVLQVAYQLAVVLRVERFSRHWAQARPALRNLLKIFLPMVMGLAVFQINTFMDNVLAMGLSPKDARDTLNLFGRVVSTPLDQGAVASLGWAQRLYEFPLGIFGIAIATAIFPALAHAAQHRMSKNGEEKSFDQILRDGLRLTVFIGLPATVGLWMVREPLTRLVYERGEFGVQDSLAVAAILGAYAPAIWAYSMNHVLTRAFHAVQDATTPLRISMWMVGLNFVLNCTLVWVLHAPGLALSTAICAVLQNVLLIGRIRRYVDAPVDLSVWKSWGRTAALSLVMGVAILPATWWFETADLSRSASALQLSVMVVGGVIVFGAGALITRADEVRWLLKRGKA